MEISKETFETSTSLAMKRSVISYKDICKGVRMNGMFNHIDEDEEADTIHESFGFKFELEEEGANPLEEEGMQDGENSETNLLFVRLSKHERKAACMSTLGKVGDSEAIWKMIWPPFPKDTTSQALATCREYGVAIESNTCVNYGEPSLGEEIEGNFGPWMMAKRKNGKLMARLETKGKPILPGPHLG
ncbi:unnamed protein product [Lupinus luteus]|uniref:Uncharacterized protein n=1 Tax=Lupinus luteus TaxID=3873 RepID=A0AAV1XYS7_LUPLU